MAKYALSMHKVLGLGPSRGRGGSRFRIISTVNTQTQNKNKLAWPQKTRRSP